LTVSAIYCNDIYESNDDISTATTINIGPKVTAYQWRRIKTNQVGGDEDWYKIQISLPGQLTLKLVNWIGTYDWGNDYDRLMFIMEMVNQLAHRGYPFL